MNKAHVKKMPCLVSKAGGWWWRLIFFLFCRYKLLLLRWFIHVFFLEDVFPPHFLLVSCRLILLGLYRVRTTDMQRKKTCQDDIILFRNPSLCFPLYIPPVFSSRFICFRKTVFYFYFFLPFSVILWKKILVYNNVLIK